MAELAFSGCSDAKLEAMAQAIANTIGSRAIQLGWEPESQWFMDKCREAARNALAVMEKSEL